VKVLVIGLDNSGKSTIINQVSAGHPPLTCMALSILRAGPSPTATAVRSSRLQLKPKKTAVVEATPTVGMSIEAFSKVLAVFRCRECCSYLLSLAGKHQLYRYRHVR
jgi:hypothetical protein